jgi:hypothetical protein
MIGDDDTTHPEYSNWDEEDHVQKTDGDEEATSKDECNYDLRLINERRVRDVLASPV